MSPGQRIWRAVVEPIFRRISFLLEKGRLRRSFAGTIVRAYGRDSIRYYENGRWVTVEAELMFGGSNVDRIIRRRCSLRWNDAGAPLNPDERKRVFQKVVEHFEQSGVKWKFDEGHPTEII